MIKEEQATQKFIDNLFFLFRALHRGIESQALKDGFTVPQRIVIGQLAKHGDLSVKELSEKVGLSHSTVSGIVDRLERKGAARRVQDLQDRRITKVAATDMISNHLKNMPQWMFSGVVDVFINASHEDQTKVFEGLSSLRRLLDSGE